VAILNSFIHWNGLSSKKIETIAREVYGADGVDYLPEAEERIAEYTRLGFDKLPICIAKTHFKACQRMRL